MSPSLRRSVSEAVGTPTRTKRTVQRDDHMTCRPPAIAVSVVTDPLIHRSRRGCGFRGLAWDRFAADAVAQHQEWQPEEPKRVIGAQLAVGDVDIELLFETRHPKCRQLARGGLNKGQVMAGMRQGAATGQHQASTDACAWHQGGREAGLRQWEPNTDVAAVVVAVGGVDPHIDGFACGGEGSDPPADVDDLVAIYINCVDPATHAAQGLTLVHRHVCLTEWLCHQRTVEQVPGTDPGPPLVAGAWWARTSPTT